MCKIFMNCKRLKEQYSIIEVQSIVSRCIINIEMDGVNFLDTVNLEGFQMVCSKIIEV